MDSIKSRAWLGIAQCFTAVLFLFSAHTALAVDGIGVEYGRDIGIKANLYQLKTIWNWNRKWLDSGTWHVGGQWEANLAFIERNASGHENLYNIGAIGLFRYYRDHPLSIGISPYPEIGLGLQFLSGTNLGSRNVSTSLQFSPNFGAGFSFGSRQQYELDYRYWHISNAGIDNPNPGLDFQVIHLAYRF